MATTLATVTRGSSNTSAATTAIPVVSSASSGNIISEANKKASTKTKSTTAKTTSISESSSPSETGLVEPLSSIQSSVSAKSSAAASAGSAATSAGSVAATGAIASGAATVIAYTAASAPAGCTATEYAQITSVVAACSTMILSAISVPASSTLDLTGLADGSMVIFAGETTFGTTANSDFNPIEIAGTDITITGAEGAIIDGNGQAYWDGEGSNGGTDKPDHFIVLDKMVNGVISNLYIQNWPTHCFDITGCDGMTLTSLTLDNSAGDEPNSASGTKAAAHNSDGFDMSSTDNLVLSNSVVYNQDDCVAVTSGSNITVTGMYCSGGHGLSIGSVGGKSNNVVSGVTFSDSTVINSENGCRIKSNADTTGSISDITYSNIKLSGITDYGIDVQQDYLNGGATGDPTNGVTISGVTFSSVTGTMSDGVDYYILCGSDSCSDFTFTDVSITGGSGDSCNFPSTGCPS